MRRPPRNNPLHLLPHLVGLTRHPVPDLTRTRLDVLGGLGRGAGGLGGGRPDVGGGGAKSGRGGARDCVADDLGAVLADQGAQVVELGALGDCVLLIPNGSSLGAVAVGRTRDAVLVAEFFQLGLAPRVDELVRDGGVGLLGALPSALGFLLHAQVGGTGVAADRGDQFVTLC